ncbi:MAG: hypothetical protein Roseis2KO_00020 [Roseivirga sp.]
MLRFICFLTLFSLTTILMAQSDTTALASDRPTQTASAFLVPKGTVQIESGFSWSTTKLGFNGFAEVSEDLITYNSTQIRFGVSKNLELLFSQSLVGSRVDDGVNQTETETEAIPTAIGARIHLFDMNDRGRPQTSFLVTLGGPLLSDIESGSTIDMRFNMQHNLGDAASLGYNIGGTVNGEFDSFIGNVSVVLGYTTSSKLTLFAELYMTFPELTDSFLQSDFGLLYSVSPNFQVDIFGGLGISRFTADSLIGAGVAIRIPGK